MRIINDSQFESETIAQDAGLGSFFFFLRSFIQIVKYRIQSSLQSEKLPHATIDPSLSACSFSISCRHLYQNTIFENIVHRLQATGAGLANLPEVKFEENYRMLLGHAYFCAHSFFTHSQHQEFALQLTH